MSDKKKKFQLRWLGGAVVVALFMLYTYKNGRSYDDFGNVGPIDATSMLLMFVASSVIVFGTLFIITALQTVMREMRSEEALEAAQMAEEAARQAEEASQLAEEAVDQVEEAAVELKEAAQEVIGQVEEAVHRIEEAAKEAVDQAEEAAGRLEEF